MGIEESKAKPCAAPRAPGKTGCGKSTSEDVYELRAKESGYASLQEAERRLGEQRGRTRPA